MLCSQCGTEAVSETKFCANCGSALGRHAVSREQESKVTYKIVAAVGEKTINGNVAIVQLEELVNEHIGEGWQPVG
jgi:hypothetical protein